MWALIVAHSSNNWGFWTLLTEMPTYMKDILDFDIKKVSFKLVCLSLGNLYKLRHLKIATSSSHLELQVCDRAPAPRMMKKQLMTENA